MNATLLILAAFAILPRLPVVDDRCELVDSNAVYSAEDGTITLKQIVYLDDHHGIIAWRLNNRPGMVPTWDRSRKCYSVVWIDNGTLRRVRCRTVVESWKPYDYEAQARDYWPTDHRKDLGVRP